MDHEVEHHVYVERAAVEHTQAVGFKEHGAVDQGGSRGHRRVKALEQANLQDLPAGCRLGHQRVGFRQGDRDGLFQQHVESMG